MNLKSLSSSTVWDYHKCYHISSFIFMIMSKLSTYYVFFNLKKVYLLPVLFLQYCEI